MKRAFLLFMLFLSCLLFSGCAPLSSKEEPNPSIEALWKDIPFTGDQFYAVAHLGYLEMTDLDFYIETYLNSDQMPVHYFSYGDYYLVIPRYTGMSLSLFWNDIETSASTLVYQDPECRPFILQCNVSDIFPDATLRLTYQGETVEFAPFLSLKDGSLDIGERGLNLTRAENDGS